MTSDMGRANRRMKRLLPIFLVAALAVLWLMRGVMSSDSIEYQGKSVKLSKPYGDYDDYKNDRINIHPSEYALVYNLVTQAPVAASYHGRETFFHAVSELKFPGYGWQSSGERPQPDGSARAPALGPVE